MFKKIMKFFKTNDALFGLIAVNVAVFVLYHFIRVFYLLFGALHYFPLARWLAAPSDLETLMVRPWTVVTCIFFHIEIFHLLFNMLWLYWFGKIFRLYFSSWQLVNVFVLGGLMGVLFYILSYNMFPVFSAAKYDSILLGASGGALAVVMAIACYVPKYSINMLFLGRVKLIVIALFATVISIVYISTGENAGGNIAHIGGIFFGYLFAINIQKGRDITRWFGRSIAWLGSFFKPKPKMKVVYSRPPTDDREYNRLKNEKQKEIDRILDKISVGGYESLTRHEKELLFSQKR